MTPKQVLKYYQSPSEFAKACLFTKEALYKWLKQGYIPAKSQYDIQCASDGRLSIGEPFEAKRNGKR